MTKNLFLIILLLVFPMHQATAFAISVSEKNGNIYVKFKDGKLKKLTRIGKDSKPLLSPDKNFVVFLRETDKIYESDWEGTMYHNQICSIKIDGSSEEILVDFQEAEKVEENLVRFGELRFSSDAKYLYFLSGAWATSAALHRYDFSKRKEEFFIPSNSYCLFHSDKCHQCDYVWCPEEYNDYIITLQHRYYVLGGSYDKYFLYNKEGKEIGMLPTKSMECLCGN